MTAGEGTEGPRRRRPGYGEVLAAMARRVRPVASPQPVIRELDRLHDHATSGAVGILQTIPSTFARSNAGFVARNILAFMDANPQVHPGLLTEENNMAIDETLNAPGNPYRTPPGMSFGVAMHSEDHGGPGLLTEDLHLIAQAHHRRGYREGQAEGQREAEAMRDELEGAYDRGYTEGHRSREQIVAAAVANEMARLQRDHLTAVKARMGRALEEVDPQEVPKRIEFAIAGLDAALATIAEHIEKAR